MRQYELMMLLNPNADEEQTNELLGRVRSFVTDRGGEVVDEDNWGKRKLAYKIGKFAEANYHLSHLQMEPDHAKSLERTLELSDDVIRHLIVRQDP